MADDSILIMPISLTAIFMMIQSANEVKSLSGVPASQGWPMRGNARYATLHHRQDDRRSALTIHRTYMLYISLIVNTVVISGDALKGPLTKDFQNWLNEHGYGNENFSRNDLGDMGSFGGREYPQQEILHEPVIFIHGNTDGALAIQGPYSSGWTNTIQLFMSKGYTSAELYVTTWGDRRVSTAGFNSHDCETLTRMRRFFDAVIAYTNAKKIDVITHSMGVTIGRRIVKGGSTTRSLPVCDLGQPLHVDTFIGIAGGNYGMCNCYGSSNPTCSHKTGFWPGNPCPSESKSCETYPQSLSCQISYSEYLTLLNDDPTREGDYVYSVLAADDDVVQYHNRVYNRLTSLIPRSDYCWLFCNYTHMELKERTAREQYDMVVNHAPGDICDVHV